MTAPARQTSASATGEAPNAVGLRMIWTRNLAIAAAAGIFLALIGAFETGETPLPTRLLYWVPIMMAGGVLGYVMAMLVNRFSSADRNPWLFGAILAGVITIPATFLV